jgi:hypothetical protein
VERLENDEWAHGCVGEGVHVSCFVGIVFLGRNGLVSYPM